MAELKLGILDKIELFLSSKKPSPDTLADGSRMTPEMIRRSKIAEVFLKKVEPDPAENLPDPDYNL